MISSQPYLGERSRRCALYNKLIDVNQNKFQEIEENGLSLLKETVENKLFCNFVSFEFL